MPVVKALLVKALLVKALLGADAALPQAGPRLRAPVRNRRRIASRRIVALAAVHDTL